MKSGYEFCSSIVNDAYFLEDKIVVMGMWMSEHHESGTRVAQCGESEEDEGFEKKKCVN